MSGMSRQRTLAPGEEPVIAVHQHWKVLAGPVVLGAAIVAVVVAAGVTIDFGKAAPVGRLVLAILAFAGLVRVVGIPVLRWRTTRYELTNRRLRTRKGIIAREGKDIPLSRITDVSFESGPLDRIFGAGTLVVESPGERGQIRLAHIPRVQYVQSALLQFVQEAEQQQRALLPDDPDAG
jgi:membrane protein YdbS with pleckstrin-like domain